MLSGNHECREAFLVGNVGVHTLVGKQQRHHRGVPFVSGKGECRVAFLIGDVGVHALVG